MGLLSIAPRDFSPQRIRSDLYIPRSDLDTDEMPCILSVLSSLLERVVIRNEKLAAIAMPADNASSKKLAAFSGIRPPSISIEQYLERIFKYANCSPSCFVVAYAYIDRLIQFQAHLRITSLNVHRFLITSVMIASKFLDDIYYDNAYYAKIGGITTREMNKLELDFLFLLEFRLQVTVSVFESYCCHLEREVADGGGYQIERTLRSICALDGESTQGSSTEKQSVMSVKCSSGS